VIGLTYQYPFILSIGVKYIPTTLNIAQIKKVLSNFL
jgi:hypothetical protein